jgi:hypothetical protein
LQRAPPQPDGHSEYHHNPDGDKTELLATRALEPERLLGFALLTSETA